MSKAGPIVIIEDDIDDKNILEDILKELKSPNPVRWFPTAVEAYNYLCETEEQPFVIICDVNLPKQNGVEFKKMVDEDKKLRKKSIPFVFYSTSVNQHLINDAYTKMTVQGFFKKESSYEQIKFTIKLILDYWKHCKHPNSPE